MAHTPRHDSAQYAYRHSFDTLALPLPRQSFPETPSAQHAPGGYFVITSFSSENILMPLSFAPHPPTRLSTIPRHSIQSPLLKCRTVKPLSLKAC